MPSSIRASGPCFISPAGYVSLQFSVHFCYAHSVIEHEILKPYSFSFLSLLCYHKDFKNPQILFTSKPTGVDKVLTKISHIDPKLTFNVFYILNHDHISKIEKTFGD